MQTFFLDKQDIVRVTGERFYKRGYDYYKKGRVYGLNYNPSIKSWRAHVRGTETYNVRVFFFEKDDLESSCDCPAYATHYTCKHIAAVLFAIGDDSWKNLQEDDDFSVFESAEQWESETFASRILDSFATKPARTQVARQPLEVQYTLISRINPHNQKHSLEIGLKIGTNKLSEVKNIRELLSRVKKGKGYMVTPTFHYAPENQEWQVEDRAILQQLIAILEHEALYESAYGSPIHDKKTLLLPPKLADDVLEAVSNQNHVFETNQKEKYEAIEFHRSMQKLKFHIEKPENGNFQLDVSDLEKYKFYESYNYLFAEGVFYQLSAGQAAIANQIYGMLPYQQGRSQVIANQNMEQFLSQVVPKFEELGEVTFAANTAAFLTSAPLKTKVFLEEENNSLIANIEFHYGDQVIYPYLPRPLNGLIIKRDGREEQKTIEALEKAGFLFMQNRFQLFHSEKIYFFLKEKLADLQETTDIRVSAGVKAMFSGTPSAFETKIEVDENSGMLDLTFDMNGIDHAEVIAIMEAMIEKKKFYRIPNGALLNLEEDAFTSLRKLTQNLQLKKEDIKEGELHLPAAKSLQIEDALHMEKGTYSQSFEILLQRLKHPEQLTFPVPEGLQATMRDYQLDGYQWLKSLSFYQLGGILADDMGLGKTLQTICYLLSEKNDRPENFKSIVVTPASLLYNWEKEIEKFAPSLTSLVIAGNKAQREALIEQANEYDILITSYPLLRKDTDLYEDTAFHSMVLDEAQAIKNDKTLTAKAVRKISARNRFALSGTPIENSLGELWALFETVSPSLLPGKQDFLAMEPAYISKVTRPFILRRLKKDVLHELPDKIETVQYSELTTGQKKVYAAYLEKMQSKIAETIETKGFQRGKLEILAGLTRLRQVCCHPSLFLENYQGKSGKQEQLLELLRELKQNGKRVLIFSQFSSMLTILAKTFEEENLEAFYLDGSTSSKDRLKMVDRFNAGEKSAFLISLKAGGTGLNLTGADTVILYDLWWNPAIEEQAAGRAHRMGQKNVVQVIRLIATGTIEEKIYQLQQKKRALVDQIIQPGESMLSALSEEELKELLQLNIS